MQIRLMPHLAGVLILLVTTTACAQQLPDFTHIVEQNAPSVVHIESSYDGDSVPVRQRMQGAQPDLPPGVPDIFRRFFGDPRGQTMPPQAREHTSLGSGFIISSDGYVLTNNHVVDGADKVTVRLQDRRTLTAKVVGTDEIYDIALLKLDATGLRPVALGDSRSLKPGQWVLAIGSPFGFDYTVTKGIISAVGRSFGRNQQYVPFIQTDVPINRGNSGGPLFNMDGEVVGINSQIFSNSGGYMGVSFSIPITIAMDAVRQIKDKGYVSRGMIGVQIQDVDADNARALGLASASGALIAVVADDSPGDQAGLQAGDVILAYDGQDVHMASDLPPMVAGTSPGDTATLRILRRGEPMTVKVTIGELPRDENARATDGSFGTDTSNPLGLTVEDLSEDQREALELDADEGVVVSRVTGVQARDAGLRPGDVILMIGQRKVRSEKDFHQQIEDIEPGATVMLLVRNQRGNTGFVTITVPKR